MSMFKELFPDAVVGHCSTSFLIKASFVDANDKWVEGGDYSSAFMATGIDHICNGAISTYVHNSDDNDVSSKLDEAAMWICARANGLLEKHPDWNVLYTLDQEDLALDQF